MHRCFANGNCFLCGTCIVMEYFHSFFLVVRNHKICGQNFAQSAEN